LSRVETISTTGITGANLGLTGSSLEQEAAYQSTTTNQIALAYINANNLLNPLYGMTNAFQGPRQVRFGFRLQF
jgi:hypothetical protein